MAEETDALSAPGRRNAGKERVHQQRRRVDQLFSRRQALQRGRFTRRRSGRVARGDHVEAGLELLPVAAD